MRIERSVIVNEEEIGRRGERRWTSGRICRLEPCGSFLLGLYNGILQLSSYILARCEKYKDTTQMAEQHRDEMPVIRMMNKIEEYFDDDGNWRLRVTTGSKFDEVSRGIFLREMAEHGRKSTAAMAAGVSVTTANWAIKNDADFNEAVAHCALIYRDRVVSHHQDLLFNGVEKKRYDNKGMVVETTREYPIRLIELELKRVDDGFRDKREINMNVSGGVLIAPAGISIEEWEKKHGETVEGEFTEAEVKSSVEKAVVIAEE